MPHHKAPLLLGDLPVAVLYLNGAEHALPMPTAGDLVLRPSRLFHHEGQSGVLTPPGFQFVTHGAGARDKGDESDLVLQTAPQGTATLGFTIGDDTPHPLQPQGQTLRNGSWGCHTIAAVAITHTEAEGYAAIPTHAQTKEDLFEVVTTGFAMPIGRPRSAWSLRFVLLGPIEGNRGGVLRQPGRRDGIALQGFEGDRTTHRVEIGRKQRIEHVPQAVIMERGTREPRLQQRHHPPLFEPFSHLIEGMMPFQNREPQGFNPTTTREPMRGVRGNETVKNRGDLQAP
jgi:hypothetical protein